MVVMVKKRYLWSLLVLFISAILLFPISLIYANRVANKSESNAKYALQQSERIWCEVLDLIHAGHKAEPPTTDSGKKFAEVIQRIRVQFKCEEKEKDK